MERRVPLPASVVACYIDRGGRGHWWGNVPQTSAMFRPMTPGDMTVRPIGGYPLPGGRAVFVYQKLPRPSPSRFTEGADSVSHQHTRVMIATDWEYPDFVTVTGERLRGFRDLDHRHGVATNHAVGGINRTGVDIEQV